MDWPPENLDEMLQRAGAILRHAGAREVYVFGSAASGQMHEHSDIDLAVSGLPPRSFFATMAKVSDVFGRTVDLVDLDQVSPLTTYLENEGELRRVGQVGKTDRSTES